MTRTNIPKNEVYQLLNTRRLPARLMADQVAALLGFNTEDIPTLVSAKLLQPLGKPRPSAVKRFAARTIEELSTDPTWLGAATKTVSQYWQRKNARRLASAQSETPEHQPPPEGATS